MSSKPTSPASSDPFRQIFKEAAQRAGNEEPAQDPFRQIFAEAMRANTPAVRARSRSSLSEIMISPVVADPDFSPGPRVNSRRLSFASAELDEQLLKSIAEMQISEEDGLVDFPIVSGPRITHASTVAVSSPQTHRTRPYSQAPAALPLIAECFSRMYPTVAPRKPHHRSRTTPTKNSLAEQLFSLERGRKPLSPFRHELSRALFDIDDVDSYSMLFAQPASVPVVVPAKLSFVPQVGYGSKDIIDAPYSEDQGNYYHNLLTVTPSSSSSDRMAAILGCNVYLRSNRTGECSVLQMEDFFSYFHREIQPTSIAFTPSGNYLIVGVTDSANEKNYVELWHVPEKGPAIIDKSVTIDGADININAVALVNGRILAGTNNGLVYEIEPKTGKIIETWEMGNEEVTSLCVSPNGKMAAVGVVTTIDDDQYVTKLYLLTPNGNNDPAKTSFNVACSSYEGSNIAFKATFSPDGKYLALGTGFDHGRLILLKIEGGNCKEIPAQLSSRTNVQLDSEKRVIFHVTGKNDDDEIIGSQVTGILWIEEKNNDVIIATLGNGEAVFLPIRRSTQTIGNSSSTLIHNNAKILYPVCRGDKLYTAAPNERHPWNSSEKGLIRVTKIAVKNRPEQPSSSLNLAGPSVR